MKFHIAFADEPTDQRAAEALRLARIRAQSLTLTRQPDGSFAYMAPEDEQERRAA